jgi:hypothetical protein
VVSVAPAAAVLPLSSVSRECARGSVEAHRITENGVFRTLALGVRASRNASLAREAIARTIRSMVEEMDGEGRLALETKRAMNRQASKRHAELV